MAGDMMDVPRDEFGALLLGFIALHNTLVDDGHLQPGEISGLLRDFAATETLATYVEGLARQLELQRRPPPALRVVPDGES